MQTNLFPTKNMKNNISLFKHKGFYFCVKVILCSFSDVVAKICQSFPALSKNTQHQKFKVDELWSSHSSVLRRTRPVISGHMATGYRSSARREIFHLCSSAQKVQPQARAHFKTSTAARELPIFSREIWWSITSWTFQDEIPRNVWQWDHAESTQPLQTPCGTASHVACPPDA